jgi:hypothetical protein
MQHLNTKTRVLQFKNGAGDVLVLTPVNVERFSVNYDTLPLLNDAVVSSETSEDGCTDNEEKKYEAMSMYNMY